MILNSLSLIVPAYKEQKTIIKEIKNLQNVLLKLVLNFEIIVVVDGFEDNTYSKIKKQEQKIRSLKVFGYQRNKGKGYAVKYGVSKSTKEIIGFIDSGMDIDHSSIFRMIKLMKEKDVDIVVGSKIHPDSKIDYPIFRKILSTGYRLLNKILFNLDIDDTQVGLKMFKRKVAKKIFSRIKINGFAFDIEALVIAKELKFKIIESPVTVNFKNNTINYFNFIKVSLSMLIDTFKIFYRFKILHYYQK